MQQHTSALVAGVLIGVLWASWHLPLFLAGLPGYDGDPASVVYYYSWVVGAAVVLGALVNAAEGSVIPAMLLHASVNQPALVESTGGTLADALPAEVLGAGPWWLIVAALVIAYGAKSMSSRPAVSPLSIARSRRAEATPQPPSERRPGPTSDE